MSVRREPWRLWVWDPRLGLGGRLHAYSPLLQTVGLMKMTDFVSFGHGTISGTATFDVFIYPCSTLRGNYGIDALKPYEKHLCLRLKAKQNKKQLMLLIWFVQVLQTNLAQHDYFRKVQSGISLVPLCSRNMAAVDTEGGIKKKNLLWAISFSGWLCVRASDCSCGFLSELFLL